jgi:mRNA interferase RelE/StbE
MTYQIEFKTRAKKELARVPKEFAQKIIVEIASLAQNPRPNGCKKLVGAEYTYRIRVGDYRVIYTLFEQQLIIEVIKIGHRKEVYKI